MKKVILGLVLVSAILAGCSNEDSNNASGSSSSAAESSSSVESSSETHIDESTAESSEVSQTEVAALIAEANEIYDEQLEVAQDLIDNPDSFTLSNHSRFQSDTSAGIRRVTEVYDMVGYGGEGIEDETTRSSFRTMQDNVSKMSSLMSQFPSEYVEE